MSRWSVALASLVVGGLAGIFLAGPLLQGQAPIPPAPPVYPKELSSYREVVKRVLPAVVMIEAKAGKQAPKKTGRSRLPQFDDPRIPDELRRFFGDQPQQQQFDGEDDGSSLGSGVVIDPKGVILTNNHVVEGASEVEVHFVKEGMKFTSHDIKTDPKTDLAIVRLNVQTPLPYLELGDSSNMEIGDRVLAVGAPFGLSGSVTAGIISAKGRNLRMNMYEDFLQTDAAINPGNSGGPLINLEGRVIGINTAIKSGTGGFQGVGLAIASNLAKSVMNQLLKDGVVHRGYLGVQIKDMTDPALAKKLGVAEKGGVLVTQVFDGSPSARAGVREGDVITSIDGKAVKEGRELQNAVASLPLGKPAEIVVVRDGKSKSLEVKIEEQPNEFGSTRVPLPKTPKRERSSLNFEKFGFEATDLTPELADQLGYMESATGALLTSVERSSLASEAGLRRGMLISKVEKQTVKSAADLERRLAKADLEQGVLLQVKSPQGGTTYVLLKATAEK